MRVENHDFFYYDPNFKGEHGDFTDNEVFSPDKRREFLEHYSDFIRKTYHLPEKSQKAVREEEAKELTELMGGPISSPKVSHRIDFTHMEASLCKKAEVFENWSLYTKRATVDKDCLVFKGDPLPPNPAATYYIKGGKRVEEIELSLYMDEAYRIDGAPILGVTSHRLISLRSGIKEIFNINIHSSGLCNVMDIPVNYYNPEAVKLGELSFGEWHTFKISLSEREYSVTLDGKNTVTLPIRCFDIPDNLFFSCGMFHNGEWRIEPKLIKTETEETKDFFKKANEADGKEEPIGEVRLPYSVGNAQNCDKVLVLRREFEAEAGKRALLKISSIDPGGKVFLDGECIADTDSFEGMELDITEKLKKSSKHLLEIRVEPRAPEVLFRWHRNVDPFNGWFCEDVSLLIINEVEITDPKVVTTFAEGKTARAVFSCKTDKPCSIRIYMAPAWPAKGEEVLLGEYPCKNEFLAEKELYVNLWSAETPELYDIRFEAVLNGSAVDDTLVETGFRTVDQRNGGVYINGKKTTLKGALIMQYLPPHSETATTHICPRDWQITWQYLMIKRMGGNMIRLHILGYGTNDVRFARYADRLGVLLIWITRYIDSVEHVEFDGKWYAKDGYIRQISERLNHPSIVMWEGSNEFHPTLEDIDNVHNAFVPAVKSVDTTRLLCPLSFHYYGGINGMTECGYYNTEGTEDQDGNPVKASPYWTDELVVRSSHPYVYSMGYGKSWELFRTQPWDEQDKMLRSKERAFLVSEFAVIGRQDPNTKEAKELYFNPYTYEFPNEDVLGFKLTQEDWRISQAYQALCGAYAVRKYRIMDADAMLWCCLMGGANDGGYLKPFIDNYGYAKYAYHTMGENFKTITCLNDTTDVKRGADFTVKPVLFAEPDTLRTVTVAVINEQGEAVDIKTYGEVECDGYMMRLPEWKPNLPEKEGYYAVKAVVL